MGKMERVDNELKKHLNEIIIREMKDPRLSTMISVTAVEATKDLKTAKVFVSVMEQSQEKEALKTLNSAAGYIRGLLFDRLKIRMVPHLSFLPDHSISHSFKIDRIIREIKESEGQNE